MKITDVPAKQAVPFAVNGSREALLATTPAGDNTASYDAGFPPVTMILKAAGGLPPKGQDMNQILYELSALARWFSAGAITPYDSTFSTAIGGYPKGAIVLGTDSNTRYMSTTDSNLTNPNTGGAGWFNLTSGYLQTSNNLSEIAAAGTTAQTAARTSILAAALAGLATQVFSVANATANAHAVPLSQMNTALALKALLNGDTNQQFSAKDATASANVVNLGQMNTALGLKANLGGSASQGFAVAGGNTPNSAVAYNQFSPGSNGNGVYYSYPGGLQICRGNITIQANSSATWTYPLSFSSAPQVFYTALTPAGSGTPSAMWINSIALGSASIYNPNSQATQINLLGIL